MSQVFSWCCGGGYDNGWLGHCDPFFPQASASSQLLGTAATRRIPSLRVCKPHVQAPRGVPQVTSSGGSREASL